MKVSGVLERFVRMAVRAVRMVVHKWTSGLKQAGVQSVVRPLPEFEEWRSLSEIVEAEHCAALSDRFSPYRKLKLAGLAFHWADDVQTHRRRDDAAQVDEDEETNRLGVRYVEDAS